MLTIGAHLSCAKGFYEMGQEMLAMNANTCQFFTRNPRGGQAKELNLNDIEAFLNLMKENAVEKILAHASYTINPCSDKEETRIFALETMADDLNRLTALNGQYYNFHPGCHVGQGIETGLTQIVSLINHLLSTQTNTTVLLETMSGKGSEIGSTFDEIDSAGYDIVHHLDDVLEEFDQKIGLKRLKMIHLNDSLTPFNSHKDRHAKIGAGSIGTEAIIRLINHPLLKDLPFILETPNVFEGYKAEIALLRANYG